jgi:hypothetical protein
MLIEFYSLFRETYFAELLEWNGIVLLFSLEDSIFKLWLYFAGNINLDLFTNVAKELMFISF